MSERRAGALAVAKTVAVTVVAAVALVAGACSSDSSPAPKATGPMAFDAVLIELFGTTDTEAYLESLERRSAELVVGCMNEAGFEFEIPDAIETLDRPDPRDVESARQIGFGIVEGARFQLTQFDLSAQAQFDPNQAYLSTLSSAEIERFFATLQGTPAPAGQRSDDPGCSGRASEAAFADWQRFSTALPNFRVLGEERDTHPEWLETRAEWQACMTARGFDYDEPDEIRADVTTRMRDTISSVYPGGQVPVRQVDGVTVVAQEVDELLADLEQFEIDAAVANAECTAPLADRFDAVERMVQQQFVDRNRAVIDDLLSG